MLYVCIVCSVCAGKTMGCTLSWETLKATLEVLLKEIIKHVIGYETNSEMSKLYISSFQHLASSKIANHSCIQHITMYVTLSKVQSYRYQIYFKLNNAYKMCALNILESVNPWIECTTYHHPCPTLFPDLSQPRPGW